ncbi:LacI family DNA-binding transcriptional regulator [Lysinibacter cavernae]|nr:substrate-binding domain-containing protein [Lysinibacter cavernae]
MSSSASGLASGRTKNIGVVVPELTRWYFTNVVEGIASGLLHHGYDLTVYSLRDGGSARRSVFEQSLLRQRVDAFIAISQELTNDELAKLRALNKPLVGVGGPLPGVHTLSIDDVAVSTEATQHLINLGHTRIAHISGTVEFEADFHLPTNRRSGYEAALTAAGIPIPHDLQAAADFTIPGGYGATQQLLTLGDRRPTAIFVSSDEMAIGSILAIREAGLTVGRDVSVVGIDNYELSDYFGLTTVAQYPQDQGRQAVELLMNVLQPGRPVSTNLITPLTTELLVRSSTGPAPSTDRKTRT